MKEELLKGLTEEQIAKVKACNNSDELLALAKEKGTPVIEKATAQVRESAIQVTKDVLKRLEKENKKTEK